MSDSAYKGTASVSEGYFVIFPCSFNALQQMILYFLFIILASYILDLVLAKDLLQMQQKKDHSLQCLSEFEHNLIDFWSDLKMAAAVFRN